MNNLNYTEEIFNILNRGWIYIQQQCSDKNQAVL